MHWYKSALCVPLFCGCQAAKIQFDWVLIDYQHCDSIIKRLVMLSAAVTFFTLCSVKSWCAAAVKSVDSICSVVLTGMTCTVINICFRREDLKEKNYKR